MTRDYGQIITYIVTVLIKRKIVDVVAERALTLLTNHCDADDDERRQYFSSNTESVEVLDELREKDHNVNPGDLGNRDVVRQGNTHVDDALDSSQTPSRGANIVLEEFVGTIDMFA